MTNKYLEKIANSEKKKSNNFTTAGGAMAGSLGVGLVAGPAISNPSNRKLAIALGALGGAIGANIHAYKKAKKEKQRSVYNLSKLEKRAKTIAILKPAKTTVPLSSIKSVDGRDSGSKLRSLKKSLESSPRMESLKEVSDDLASKSLSTAARNGNGNAPAIAVKKMQQQASLPLSYTQATNQRVKIEK